MNAYMNLALNECELLIVYEASDETNKYLSSMAADFEYFPIGRDALVFIVNENNPVKSLSIDQIVDIYSGNIDNWKDVGGKNIEIDAFQRNATSGSQALMKKLVMKNVEPAETPKEKMPSEMGMLIDALAEYNNESNAIGYSVFYYASQMYTKPGLKFIGVNGVDPSNETIKNKKYPLTNDFYAVIRKNEPENSPARKLAMWLTGENGKKMIEKCGYVSN